MQAQVDETGCRALARGARVVRNRPELRLVVADAAEDHEAGQSAKRSGIGRREATERGFAASNSE
jgi:hypothetical protein